MEDQCSPLCWPYYYQQEGMEELKHSLLYTTLELETTILSAQEEITRKDDEIVHLKSLVTKISKERDEALAKCQTLMLEKLLLGKKLQQQQEQQFQQQQHLVDSAALSSGTTSIEDEPRKGEPNVVQYYSSSDSDENVIASPGKELLVDVTEKIVLKNPLPEKGNFLQAVMEAGPLLQTLLLAGPLPRWEHPPPQLKTIDIPPVTISSSQTPGLLHPQDSSLSPTNGLFSKKRVLESSSDQLGFDSSPPNSKYQRVVHQSSLTNI